MKSPEVSLTESLPFGCTTTGAPIVLEVGEDKTEDDGEDEDEEEGDSNSSTGSPLWSSIQTQSNTRENCCDVHMDAIWAQRPRFGSGSDRRPHLVSGA